MKRAKYLFYVLFVTLIVAAVNFLFFSDLENIGSDDYYIEYKFDTEETRSEFISDLKDITKKNNVLLYSKNYSNDSIDYTTISLYYDEEAKEYIENKYAVAEKVYTNFFGGKVEVVCENMEKAALNEGITRYYLVGDNDDLLLISEWAFSSYTQSSLKKNNNYNFSILYKAVIVLLFLFMLMLTVLDISYQKKEITIGLTLGNSIGNRIIKNIIKDTCFLMLVSSLFFIFARRITGTFGNIRFFLIVFLIFLLANSLLYISCLFVNVRKDITKITISESSLANYYVIKFLLVSILIILAVTSILNISKYISYSRDSKLLSEYSDYRFLRTYFYVDRDVLAQGGVFDYVRNVEFQIFKDELLKDDVAMNMALGESEWGNYYVFVNEKGAYELEDYLKYMNEEKIVHILIPKYLDSYETNITEEVEDYILPELYLSCGDLESEVIYYDSMEYGYFGFWESRHYEYTSDPIIIYMDYDEEYLIKLLENIEITEDAFANFNDCMFMITEDYADYLEEKYDYDEWGLYLASTSVTNEYEYYKNALFRVCIINIGLLITVIVLIISISVILTKIDLEINSMEIMLRKLNGYSVFSVNRGVFVTSLVSSLFSGALVFILSLLLLKLDMKLTVIVFVFIVLTDYLLVFTVAELFTRKNIVEKLKGKMW